MLALMPRCTKCVLCREPIQGKGRIDRIYCSASCRTLAWRARSGDRWAGRRKSRPPQPGSYVARSALPLLAMRMKAALEAKKRRVAELESQLEDADPSTRLVGGAGVAVGAMGLLMALRKRLGRKHWAELAQLRAALEAEESSRRAEMDAMQKQAALRQAALEKQLAAAQHHAEQAARDRQTAAFTISELERTAAALRQQHEKDVEQHWAKERAMARLHKQVVDARGEVQVSQKALLGESRRRENIQVQLAAAQQQLIAERANWQTAYSELETDRQELEWQLSAERSSWQTAYSQLEVEAQTRIQQLSTNCSKWQTAYGQLEADAQRLARHLDGYAWHHQEELAALTSRAETAEATVSALRLQARRQNHTHRAQLEQIVAAARPELPSQRQRQQTPASLSPKKKPKALPAKKKKTARKKLPPKRGFVGKILIGAAGTTVGIVAAIAGVKGLGNGERKKLPPKEERAYFEVIPVGERKRLPPKRD